MYVYVYNKKINKIKLKNFTLREYKTLRGSRVVAQCVEINFTHKWEFNKTSFFYLLNAFMSTYLCEKALRELWRLF